MMRNHFAQLNLKDDNYALLHKRGTARVNATNYTALQSQNTVYIHL